MNTMIKEQERVFQTTDTSNGGPPFFDEANDFAKVTFLFSTKD